MISKSVLRQTLNARPANSFFQRVSSPARVLSARLPASSRARITARWYSDETKTPGQNGASDESLGDMAPKGDGPTTQSTENPLKKELEAKNKEILEFKDKYLRQVAEFRNLQERSSREMRSARDFAIQKFAKDLVESVDTFDLALSQVPEEKLAEPSKSSTPPQSPSPEDPYKDLRQLHSGLKMTETVLMNTLKKHGLERFDPGENGDKFDPNLHEATFQTPMEGKQDGTVFYTTQKGFMLNGRVLRAAKVGVVKNS